MPEESSTTTSHLSVVMTTTDQLQSMGADSVTSSSSSHAGAADLYFQSAVVIIGIVGAAANALILYAMIASKQHKKQLLIFNQNVFDLCSSLLLIITYAVKLVGLRLTGIVGYWLCMLLLNENLLWCSINGSVINLLSITVERYLKVVHPARSKNWLRRWVILSAMAFAWIAGLVYNMVVGFLTSAVVDGVCYGYVVWNSHVAAVAHGIWNFTTFLVVVIFTFIFCYGRILYVIRRQASVMAGHATQGSSATQTHSNQVQSSVIKTMILVSAFYVISGTPVYVYFLLVNVKPDFTLLNTGYYIIVFISFFYICANPFVYAVKFDPVRRILLDLIPCRKSQEPG